MKLLTRNEVAAMLRVTPRHVCNLQNAGLPFIKLGAAIRYEEASVMKFLEANRTVRAAGSRKDAPNSKPQATRRK